MFSMKQKQYIADVIENLLLSLNHPEMPAEKPEFMLVVHGKESWSFANIEPNHHFDSKSPGVNPFNEIIAHNMRENKK